jgi:predicted metal-dependent enzyme (double-stranded beta helix superfamily)
MPVATSLAPLSQAQLRQLASGLASQPGSWISEVRYCAHRRWYQLLEQRDDYEVWLLSWLPGQQTGFHDHGRSAGAFAVANGCLEERRAPGRRPETRGTVLTAGSARSFGPWYIHNVLNTSGYPAVSVHAYSPPLTTMHRFEVAASRLVAGAPEPVRQ